MAVNNKKQLEFLLIRYLDDKATSVQKQELGTLLLDTDNEESALEIMQELIASGEGMADYQEENWQQEISNLIKKIKEPNKKGAKILPIVAWKKWAIAASVIFLIAVNYMIWKPTEPVVVASQPADVPPPSTNRAMITLANGKTIYLDSMANGSLLQQNGIEAIKLADGKIIYKGSSNEVIYNTLSNPRGSKVIDITLSDGSRVWLNAGSSVTYPIAFIGNERKISLTGEAYFEIAHDQLKPFIVTKGDASITVLGTKFNVNAYDDEADIKATLLEGIVKASIGTILSKTIKPVEQAPITDQILVSNAVDIEQVMAWKNGLFAFNRTDLKMIMREIGRWYDLTVSYEKNLPEKLYNGEVSRDVNVSDVLKILEFAGAHFTIKGKTILVGP